VYDNDGNLVSQGVNNQQQRRNVTGGSGGLNPNSAGPNGAFGGQQGWNPNGARSPALSNSSGRFGGSDDGSMAVNNGVNGLGIPGGFAMGMGMGSPGLGMPGMPGMGVGGMGQMSPFNMMNMMGMSPEAQLLAAQMAASGFGTNGWMNMNAMAGGMNGAMGGRAQRGPGSARSTSGGNKGSNNGREGGGGGKKDEEDVDPALLNDIPAWLRSLRLHKYTPNFEGMKWQDMVVLDEAALEKQGVAALGARRKMLKTFEIVRKKMGIEGPENI